jgi:hypothetical protein
MLKNQYFMNYSHRFPIRCPLDQNRYNILNFNAKAFEITLQI